MGLLIHGPPEPPPGPPGPPPGPPGAPPGPLSGWFLGDLGVQTDLKKAFFGACRPCIENCTVQTMSRCPKELHKRALGGVRALIFWQALGSFRTNLVAKT